MSAAHQNKVYQWRHLLNGRGVKGIGLQKACAACVLRQSARPAGDERGLTPDVLKSML